MSFCKIKSCFNTQDDLEPVIIYCHDATLTKDAPFRGSGLIQFHCFYKLSCSSKQDTCNEQEPLFLSIV